MTQIVANVSRRQRSHLRSLVVAGALPLFLLSPKQFDGYAGQKGWFYATQHDGKLVVVSKNPVATRDLGRAAAVDRFGCKVKEIRKSAKKAA